MAQLYTFTTSASEAFTDNRWPRRLILEILINSNVAANTSTIYWTVKVDGTDSSAYAYLGNTKIYLNQYKGNYPNDKIWIMGSASGTTSTVQVYSGQTVQTGSYTVDHNIDGTSPYKFTPYITSSISDTASGWDYVSYGTVISSDTEWFTPLTIPRASTVTCTTVEVGRNPTITINSPSTAFTHTLRYEFGDLSGTIATNVSGGAYTSWSIPSSFLNEMTSVKYMEGTIYCDTYNSGTLNGTESTTFRVNVPSTYGPTISPTIKDVNPATLALTGDENKIIQFYNTISYDIGAFTSSGATITSCKITCGGKSASTMTGTLTNVESNAFQITATDSRGYTTTEIFYKDFIPYIKLTAKLQLVSIDTNGSGAVAISGNMFRGSLGATDNQPVVSYRYKSQYGEWSDWTEVVYNIINDSYYAEVEFSNLDYQDTYIFEAKAVDEITTVETEQLVVRCMPVFDWNNDDFQFNVPVAIEGNLTITGNVEVTGNVISANEPTAMVDFIVEQGTTDGWTWRKWNSGIAECWCKKSVSATISTTWGSLYASGALTDSNLTLPFTFIEVPVINVTVTNNGAGVFIMASGSWAPPSTSTTGAFELLRAVSSTTSNSYGLNYQVNGRWK